MDAQIGSRFQPRIPISRSLVLGHPHRQVEQGVDDNNNNRPRQINNQVGHPAPNNLQMETIPVGFSSLPPVSTTLALIQILLFCSREHLNILEQDVHVSWKTVMTDGEYWRLAYAQYFHFSRVHLFLNCCALIAIGRYMERKIHKLAMIVIIQVMGMSSNTLYIFLNSYFCSGVNNESTIGFMNTVFSLRMIRVFLMDAQANDGHGEPTLFFGFFPVFLPEWLVAWHPLFETMIFQVMILDHCIVSNVSGILSALQFPYFVEKFRGWILIPIIILEPPRTARSLHTLRNRNVSAENDRSFEDRNSLVDYTMPEGLPDPADDESFDDESFDEEDDENDNYQRGE